MSEHLCLFSQNILDIEDDFSERQPLEDVLIHETGILSTSFGGLVAGYIALASFDF